MFIYFNICKITWSQKKLINTFDVFNFEDMVCAIHEIKKGNKLGALQIGQFNAFSRVQIHRLFVIMSWRSSFMPWP